MAYNGSIFMNMLNRNVYSPDGPSSVHADISKFVFISLNIFKLVILDVCYFQCLKLLWVFCCLLFMLLLTHDALFT